MSKHDAGAEAACQSTSRGNNSMPKQALPCPAENVSERFSMCVQGYGTLLMEAAERIAREEHRATKLAVISGVGTRHYYRKLGYELEVMATLRPGSTGFASPGAQWHNTSAPHSVLSMLSCRGLCGTAACAFLLCLRSWL